MGDETTSASLFAQYELGDVPRVSDPEAKLYRAFGLKRGSLAQVMGPAVWWRGFQSFILNRHRVGKLVGDGFQLPGVFLIQGGRILRSYIHQTSAERPDYVTLAMGPP
jgi:hypothetical protein